MREHQHGQPSSSARPAKPPKHAPRQQQDFAVMPLSPLVFRSGRPFGGAGESSSAAGMTWPLPGTVAATVRTHLCAAAAYQPSPQDDFIHGLWVHGPLRCTWSAAQAAPDKQSDLTLWLPKPANARQRPRAGDSAQTVRLTPKPWPKGCGADMPNGLLPLQPHDGRWADVESAGPGDWRLSDVVDWLTHRAGLPSAQRTLPPLVQGQRVHIALDQARQTKSGHLYINELLDFAPPLHGPDRLQHGLWMRLSAPQALPANAPDLEAAMAQLGQGSWRLGADGGVASWRATQSDRALTALQSLCQAMAIASGRAGLVGKTLVLYLATPACFGRNGWYPDGLRPSAGDRSAPSPLIGRLEGFPLGWEFELLAAAVPGWQAQGSLKNPHHAPGQAKGRLGALTRLAPAGSMYWLKVRRQGPPVDWAALMLSPCCRVDHGRDGHGLALYALDSTV